MLASQMGLSGQEVTGGNGEEMEPEHWILGQRSHGFSTGSTLAGGRSSNLYRIHRFTRRVIRDVAPRAAHFLCTTAHSDWLRAGGPDQWGSVSESVDVGADLEGGA